MLNHPILQALGQQPLTFHRQVLSLCMNPSLLEHEHVHSMFAPDAIERARFYMDSTHGMFMCMRPCPCYLGRHAHVHIYISIEHEQVHRRLYMDCTDRMHAPVLAHMYVCTSHDSPVCVDRKSDTQCELVDLTISSTSKIDLTTRLVRLINSVVR
jgi:hypothetical protein